MSIITQYVSLEVALASLFTTMLKANPSPAVAMLGVIKNNNIRNEGFRAVAETTLTEENLSLLNGVLAECEIADKERNRIAHWVWAVERQLPDAVALVDPRKITAIQQQLQILNTQSDKPSVEELGAIVEQIRAAALIYNADDFQAINKHITRTIVLATTLSIVISHPEGHLEGAKARRMLLNTPEIKRWLARTKS